METAMIPIAKRRKVHTAAVPYPSVSARSTVASVPQKLSPVVALSRTSMEYASAEEFFRTNSNQVIIKAEDVTDEMLKKVGSTQVVGTAACDNVRDFESASNKSIVSVKKEIEDVYLEGESESYEEITIKTEKIEPVWESDSTGEKEKTTAEPNVDDETIEPNQVSEDAEEQALNDPLSAEKRTRYPRRSVGTKPVVELEDTDDDPDDPDSSDDSDDPPDSWRLVMNGFTTEDSLNPRPGCKRQRFSSEQKSAEAKSAGSGKVSRGTSKKVNSSDNSGVFKCSQCDEQYSTKAKLTRHMHQHTTSLEALRIVRRHLRSIFETLPGTDDETGGSSADEAVLPKRQTPTKDLSVAEKRKEGETSSRVHEEASRQEGQGLLSPKDKDAIDGDNTNGGDGCDGNDGTEELEEVQRPRNALALTNLQRSDADLRKLLKETEERNRAFFKEADERNRAFFKEAEERNRAFLSDTIKANESFMEEMRNLTKGLHSRMDVLQSKMDEMLSILKSSKAPVTITSQPQEPQISMGDDLSCSEKNYLILRDSVNIGHDDWGAILLRSVFGKEAPMYRTRAGSTGMKVFPKMFLSEAKSLHEQWLRKQTVTDPVTGAKRPYTKEEIYKYVDGLPRYLADRSYALFTSLRARQAARYNAMGGQFPLRKRSSNLPNGTTKRTYRKRGELIPRSDPTGTVTVPVPRDSTNSEPAKENFPTVTGLKPAVIDVDAILRNTTLFNAAEPSKTTAS